MRKSRFKNFAVRCCCAAAVVFGVAGAVRAQPETSDAPPSSADEVGADAPLSLGDVDIDYLLGHTKPEPIPADPVIEVRPPVEIETVPDTPSLADVDIDYLLGTPHTPVETTKPAAVTPPPASTRERIRDLRRSLGTESGRAALRARVDRRARALAAAAKRRSPPSLAAALNEIAAAPDFADLQNTLLLAVATLFAGLVTLRLLRGKGSVVVNIEYPAELRGTFSVRVSRRRARSKVARRKTGRITTPEEAHRAKRDAGPGSRTERTLVARETRFDDLSACTWFVTIDGFLQPAEGGDVIATHLVEREVRCHRRRTVRVTFDLHPEGCVVDVQAVWDRQPVQDARIAQRGVPGSVRGLRGGAIRLAMPRGAHTLVIGSADRVAELAIDVDSYRPQSHTVDLAGRENTIFTGCPPAVDPFLSGDVAAAARALEREGQSDVANLLLARMYIERGEKESAMRFFEAADRHFEAAELAIEADDWERALPRLQLVPHDDPNYERASDLLLDGYLQAGDLDLAAQKVDEIVRQSGVNRVSLEACDQLAEQLEERGDHERALEMLEIVNSRDPSYPNVATRIEVLRKQLENEQNTQPVTVRGAQHSRLTAGFPGDFRYQILEEIGRGGMGVVFKARDQRLGRIVALKHLPDNLRNHPKAIELFLREARSAAALNHPNIVTVFDAAQEGDLFYITMELLEGSPLQSILEKRKRLKPRDVVRLGIQVAGGLQYAHEQRVVHRDIKTGNLFFTTRKRLKIMDFGLAKMVEEVRRASTVIGGTPFYMAPEQAVGGVVDHRADLYALGVTLYELLTGGVPFAEGDVAYHHRHTPPPDPRERCDDLPDPLAELILHMLAKSPDDRCGSAARVAERLQEISKTLD